MIFNPKAVNKSILESIKEETNQLEKDYPTLAMILVQFLMKKVSKKL